MPPSKEKGLILPGLKGSKTCTNMQTLRGMEMKPPRVILTGTAWSQHACTWGLVPGQTLWGSETYLVGLDQDEDVVHPHSQHKERDDFYHNKGEGDPNVAEDAQGAGHRAQHDQDSSDAQGDLWIHLEMPQT